MNNKEFFDRTIFAMLEKYPAPDKDMIIKYAIERTDFMTEHKEKRIPKKAVMIPVIIAAVAALTGAVIHRFYTVGYEMSDIITELKVGRYYLETADGYSTDCYIEVFDDNKLQFFGIEKKESFDNGNYYDWNSAPVEYRIFDIIPFIAINDAWNTLYDDDGGAHLGIRYADENTLCDNIWIYEYPDAKDHTPEADRDTFEQEGIRGVHYVYEPRG